MQHYVYKHVRFLCALHDGEGVESMIESSAGVARGDSSRGSRDVLVSSKETGQLYGDIEGMNTEGDWDTE